MNGGPVVKPIKGSPLPSPTTIRALVEKFIARRV